MQYRRIGPGGKQQTHLDDERRVADEITNAAHKHGEPGEQRQREAGECPWQQRLRQQTRIDAANHAEQAKIHDYHRAEHQRNGDEVHRFKRGVGVGVGFEPDDGCPLVEGVQRVRG